MVPPSYDQWLFSIKQIVTSIDQVLLSLLFLTFFGSIKHCSTAKCSELYNNVFVISVWWFIPIIRSNSIDTVNSFRNIRFWSQNSGFRDFNTSSLDSLLTLGTPTWQKERLLPHCSTSSLLTWLSIFSLRSFDICCLNILFPESIFCTVC